MQTIENLTKMGKNFESDIVDRVSDKVSTTIDKFVARPSRARWFLMGAAIGALGVIFLDPVNGAKRRQAVRDKAMDWGGSLKSFGEEKWHDLQDKSSAMKSRVESETRH